MLDISLDNIDDLRGAYIYPPLPQMRTGIKFQSRLSAFLSRLSQDTVHCMCAYISQHKFQLYDRKVHTRKGFTLVEDLVLIGFMKVNEWQLGVQEKYVLLLKLEALFRRPYLAYLRRLRCLEGLGETTILEYMGGGVDFSFDTKKRLVQKQQCKMEKDEHCVWRRGMIPKESDDQGEFDDEIQYFIKDHTYKNINMTQQAHKNTIPIQNNSINVSQISVPQLQPQLAYYNEESMINMVSFDKLKLNMSSEELQRGRKIVGEYENYVKIREQNGKLKKKMVGLVDNNSNKKKIQLGAI